MTLSRRALIILAPEDDIPGVKIDGTNWISHLRSPEGGAWLESEIQSVQNPNNLRLGALLEWINVADYTFIAFSGHGSARSETETVLYINDKPALTSKDLITKAGRQSLVLDCCRKLPVRKYAADAQLARTIKMESYKDPSLARLLFNQHLGKCDPFRVRLHGCALNQSSGDSDAFGGYYTSALIRAARSAVRGEILGMREAHMSARQAVIQREPSQTPTGEYPRSGPTFPIGIGL